MTSFASRLAFAAQTLRDLRRLRVQDRWIRGGHRAHLASSVLMLVLIGCGGDTQRSLPGADMDGGSNADDAPGAAGEGGQSPDPEGDSGTGPQTSPTTSGGGGTSGTGATPNGEAGEAGSAGRNAAGGEGGGAAGGMSGTGATGGSLSNGGTGGASGNGTGGTLNGGGTGGREGGASGNGGAGGMEPGCEHECAAQGLTECSDGELRSCIEGADGCLDWGGSMSCPTGACGNTSSCAGCNNQCDAGQSMCSAAELIVCEADVNGCLDWSPPTACEGGFCLNTTTCGTCTHQCEQGTTLCQDGRRADCLVDGNGCRVWGPRTDCPSGFCEDQSMCGVCNDPCTEGGRECTDGSVRTCVADTRGCLDWTETMECPTGLCVSAVACEAGFSVLQLASEFNEQGQAVGIAPNGDTIVVGYAGDPQESYVVVDRANGSDYARLWATEQNTPARGVVADAQNNYYVGGWGGPLEPSQYMGLGDPFLRQVLSDGTEGWTVQWGTVEPEAAFDLAMDTEQNVVVVGYIQDVLEEPPNRGSTDFFVTKLSLAGEVLWTDYFGTTGLDTAHAVAIDSRDDIIVAGRASGSLDGNEWYGIDDLFLTRWTKDGTRLNSEQWGTDAVDIAWGIAVDSSDNLFVTGETQGDLDSEQNAGGRDVFLTKWNADGTRAWTRLWGSEGHEYGRDVAVDSAGFIYVAVEDQDAMQPDCMPGDAIVLRYSPDGTQVTPYTFDSCEEEAALGITIDQNDRVFVTGFTYGQLGDFYYGGRDMFLIRLQP